MWEIMFYPFLALLSVALVSGAYGCQMMWHKVACLGDALSHGALLGLAVGIFIGVDENIALFCLSVLWGFFLWILTKTRQNTLDTIMAFLMQASMALAILLFSVSSNGGNAELMHAFLGDVLMITPDDLIAICALNLVLLIILKMCWKSWTLIAISPDLAKAQRIKIGLMQFIFFTAIGFFIAIAMKLLGALLAPAFFIIPALIARPFSQTPEKMAVFSTLIAVLCSAIGLPVSFYLDLPTGASVIVICLIAYCGVVFSAFIKQMLIKHRAY